MRRKKNLINKEDHKCLGKSLVERQLLCKFYQCQNNSTECRFYDINPNSKKKSANCIYFEPEKLIR